MRIYVAHSKDFDYKNELYLPIRNDERLAGHEILLPHEFDRNSSNSREFYASLDMLIAEVTYPATGLGIELGWAYDSGIPIHCLYRKGQKYSGSIRAVTENIYEYNSIGELLDIIDGIVNVPKL